MATSLIDVPTVELRPTIESARKLLFSLRFLGLHCLGVGTKQTRPPAQREHAEEVIALRKSAKSRNPSGLNWIPTHRAHNGFYEFREQVALCGRGRSEQR